MKRGLLALLFAFGVTVSFGFHVPPRLVPRLPTSLEMGLGSFVKKRFGGGGRGDEEEPAPPRRAPPPPGRQRAPPKQQRRQAPGGQRPPAPAPRANLPPPPPSRKQAAPQRPPPEPRRAMGGPETTQDRINRVKKGKMTEEEKQNFLASTLRSSLQGNRSPAGPLRQELPNEDAATGQNSPSATPFPKDSMLREVVTGRKESPSLDPWTDSNKKKKEYLDMVTNPNRFNTFNAKTPDPAPPVEEEYDYPIDSTDSPLPGADDTDSDLASRLEAGAYAEEQRQREMRRQIEEQREQDRLRQIELQRQREEDLAMREAESLRKKREAMERAKEEEERKATEEQVKQEQMMQAQQDYWKDKLEAERARKLQKLSDEDREAAEARAAEEERLAEEAELLKSMVNPPRQPQAPAPPPDLDSFNSPLPPLPAPAEATFMDEQEMRQAEVEAQRDAQLAKLKALNSPLPVGPPAGGIRPEMSPQYAPPPAAVPDDTYAAPAPGPSMSVLDLMKQKNAKDAAARAEAPAPAPQDSGGGGFLGRMFGGDDGQEPSQAPPPPQERRVVRQALPLEDDEDDEDDFDTFARSGPNKNMSIKDAMQSQGEDMEDDGNQDQRSKMWGVDMSRFND